jgi:hypothetical protein
MGALFYEPAALTAELWALEELIIVSSERTEFQDLNEYHLFRTAGIIT